MAACRGSSSKWFFTREQLDNTPSRRCGIEPDRELSYRQQSANLIQDMGQRLNVYPFVNMEHGEGPPRDRGGGGGGGGGGGDVGLSRRIQWTIGNQ